MTMNPNPKFFEYAHLPKHLQEVSKEICDIAKHMDETLPNSEEDALT